MKIATIEQVTEINSHPNADKLEIAKVLGYQCIVPKNAFTSGELVVFIQPDTVLPNEAWTEVYKKLSPNRVKAIKLRGEWSFGIVEKVDKFGLSEASIGTEVSTHLKIVKYETPLPNDLQIKGRLPFNIPATDEERYQNIELEKYLGRSVDISLKIDGQSVSYFYKDGLFGVLGRNYELKLGVFNNYTRHVNTYDIESKLSEYCKNHGVNLVLRGESYGKGIQSSNNNVHSRLENDVKFYSVYLIDEMRYAGINDKHYSVCVCDELGLPHVDIVGFNVVLTEDLISFYADKAKEINERAFEGVVVRGDDFSFKIINKHYDSLK